MPNGRIGNRPFFNDQIHCFLGAVTQRDQDATRHRHAAPAPHLAKDGDRAAILDYGQRCFYPTVQFVHRHRHKDRVRCRQMHNLQVRVIKKSGRHTLSHAEDQAHTLGFEVLYVFLGRPGGNEKIIGDFRDAHYYQYFMGFAFVYQGVKGTSFGMGRYSSDRIPN